MIAGEATAEIINRGGEQLVDYAVSFADTPEEAAGYADVVLSSLETVVTVAGAVGGYKATKAVAAKLSNLKANYSASKIKETFIAKNNQRNIEKAEVRVSDTARKSDNRFNTEITKSEVENQKKIQNETDPQKIKSMASKIQRDYPNSINTALKQRVELAFKADKYKVGENKWVGILSEDGKLTPEAIRHSKRIELKEKMSNKSVVNVLTADGSKISDWGKYTTESVTLGNGERCQIHFYMNQKKGKIDYITKDYKIKSIVPLKKHLE